MSIFNFGALREKAIVHVETAEKPSGRMETDDSKDSEQLTRVRLIQNGREDIKGNGIRQI